MKTKVAKLINLLCLFGTVGWYCSHPDWEPIITGIAFFGTLIGLELAEKKSQKNNPDIILYNRLIELIPSGNIIEFLKNHDFGGPLNSEYLNPLRDFNYYWDNAEYEFLNPKLEAKKRDLMKATNEFIGYFALNTWSLGGNIQSVPADWQDDNPERWEKTRSELNRLSDRIVTVHQELVRMAKKILHV